MASPSFLPVIPAKAGTHQLRLFRKVHGVWVPAFAGMTGEDESGFTLVELLVSLMIFGILAAGGVSLLAFSVRAQASAQGRLDGMAELRRLASALTADLAQAVPRTSRNAIGERIAAFGGTAGTGDMPFLTLTRSGWSNSGKAPRSSLQKVEYRLNGDAIERAGFAATDGSEAPAAAVLYRGVQRIALRYRIDADWQGAWAPTRLEALPRAVELVIVPKDGPEIRQLFLVGSGYQK